MYILPDFPKSRNLNKNHVFFNKINIIKRKSKSADLKKRSNRPITPLSLYPVQQERSKSAYLSKNFIRFFFVFFKLI